MHALPPVLHKHVQYDYERVLKQYLILEEGIWLKTLSEHWQS